MRIVNRYINLLRYGVRNRFIRPRKKYPDFAFDKDNLARLEDFLVSSGCESAVAFVGLKQVKHSLDVDNPFTTLHSILGTAFSTLLVPTFTPSVLNTGIFNATTTPSENGTFSQLFLRASGSRTLCPFKSYALQGARTAEILSLATHNDYAEGGAYYYINSHDIQTVNIGTSDLRFGAIHYAEYVAGVPYLLQRKLQITVIAQNGDSSEGEYLYLDYKTRVKFNRDKIERDLLKAGVATKLVINDLIVRILPEQRYFEFLMNKLRKDPYYLVD